MNEDLSSADLLYGAAAIGAFLGLTRKQVEPRIARGEIPTFKLGGKARGTVCARRTTLRAHLAKLEREANGPKAGDDQ